MDTLILGCTHYPPFKRAIRSVLGARVTLIDSGEATARKLRREVGAAARAERAGRAGARGRRPRRAPRGALRCYVSDVPLQFEAVGKRFLGHPMGRAQWVPQDDLPWFERPPVAGGR